MRVPLCELASTYHAKQTTATMPPSNHHDSTHTKITQTHLWRSTQFYQFGGTSPLYWLVVDVLSCKVYHAFTSNAFMAIVLHIGPPHPQTTKERTKLLSSVDWIFLEMADMWLLPLYAHITSNICCKKMTVTCKLIIILKKKDILYSWNAKCARPEGQILRLHPPAVMPKWRGQMLVGYKSLFQKHYLFGRTSSNLLSKTMSSVTQRSYCGCAAIVVGR